MRVKELMLTDPTCAVVPSSRAALVEQFLLSGHSGYPVIKEHSKKLAGTVTRLELFEQPQEEQTSLIMNPNPTTTYPLAPLEEAARLVRAGRLRVLPVVN